jgi:DNA-binding NarL/FixJ family response regulator
MATDEGIKIIIIAERSPRAETLTSMITGGIGKPANITVKSPADLGVIDGDKHADLCIIDLMSSTGPVVSTITSLREKQPGAKVIALHIYKTPELVRPLYDIGVDGYLFHDPPKKELAAAIEIVLGGGVYVPPFISIG